MDFDRAFDRLLSVEGGLVNDLRDPGGETKFGISKRMFPSLNIEALTREDAARIYRNRYWEAIQADSLPGQLRYPVFDASVHSGVSQSVRWLQQALGDLVVDGRMGPATLERAQEVDATELRARLLGLRLAALSGMKGWPVFGKGWARRIAALLQGD